MFKTVALNSLEIWQVKKNVAFFSCFKFYNYYVFTKHIV